MPVTELLLAVSTIALSMGAWFFRQLDKRMGDLAAAVSRLSSDLRVLQVKSENLAEIKDQYNELKDSRHKLLMRILRLEEHVRGILRRTNYSRLEDTDEEHRPIP